MFDITKCTNLLNSQVYQDILDGKTSDYIIEKHILHNVPFYFKDNMNLYFEIKKCISKKFNIPITNIFLVGSGQFGFSLNPIKEYRDFIEEDNEETNTKASDLDFAIISTKLFDEIWAELYDFRINNIPHNKEDDKKFKMFKDYLFKGWIRPDAWPFDFCKKTEWFEFFTELNPLVNRQVSCGIFRNEECFIKNYKYSIDELTKRTKEII